MIKRFEKKALAVEGCFTYTAIRDCKHDEHPDVIEYFHVTKNPTDPAMQQVNVSRSKLNVIRGIHISAFPKVVFCPTGRIFDVVVDMRPDSPTFKKWCGAWIDKDTHIVCPPFCAHGVFAGEEDSALCYYQGGTFFPHLDYAIQGFDKNLSIEWPHPVDGDKFVMSEKDLSAAPADEKLWATIKARMDDPIADMHTVTNSDAVVVSENTSDAMPIVRQLHPARVHVLQQNAANRESLRAAFVSLRPKDGVIYIISEREKTSTELLVELMNVIHVCDELKHQLVIIAREASREVETVAELAAKECGRAVAFLVGQCLLHRGLEAKEIANRLAKTKFVLPSFTNLDEMAAEAVKVLQTKRPGKFRYVNPGKLDFSVVKQFCAKNGVELPDTLGSNLEHVSVPEFNHITDAQKSFYNLTHH